MENRKIKLYKLIKSERGGFTLVEVLVALFLLFIIISASSALVSKALSSVQSTKAKFIASYLTQEGIEIVRNIRDGNWVSQNSWDNSLSADQCADGCEIDYQNQSLSSYSDRYLKVDSNGFYNYTNGNSTIFKRKIIIQVIPDIGLSADYHLRVISEVSWTQRGQSYKLSAIEDLYNWYESSS